MARIRANGEGRNVKTGIPIQTYFVLCIQCMATETLYGNYKGEIDPQGRFIVVGKEVYHECKQGSKHVAPCKIYLSQKGYVE